MRFPSVLCEIFSLFCFNKAKKEYFVTILHGGGGGGGGFFLHRGT